MAAPAPFPPGLETHRHYLKRVLGGPVLSVESLHGGLTNQNYVVRTNTHAAVARLTNPVNDRHLGIDRLNEVQTAKIAASTAIGAHVLAANPARQIFVAELLVGQPISKQRIHQRFVLQRVAHLLRRMHSGPSFPGRFSVFERATSFITHATQAYPRAALSSPQAALQRRFAKLSERALRQFSKIRAAASNAEFTHPTHNDIHRGNMIEHGRIVRLIDWEYAAMGDPYFDLGMLVAYEKLGRDATTTLLTSYLGRRPTTDERARLQNMRHAALFYNAAWFYLLPSIAPVGDFYLWSANQFQDRFLRETANEKH